ncbi:MAG: DEAD/DEAH box helicase family protein [Synechococcales bacterium]|nr:DEAD/DEAH box helicase family protein [Synechococcales bacterium]
MVTEKPLTPPTLRPYQAALIHDLYQAINQGYRRIAIIAGTGAGKTIIGGQICADAEAQGCWLLFIVHLDVLVGQTYDKMKAFGLRCGFIKAGWQEDPTAPIQIASIQTMANRHWWRKWPASIVFYDEAHTTAFSRVGQQVLYRTHPDAVHLGMTATPYRLGEGQMGDHFQTFVAAPIPSELQRMGFLATMQYYGVPSDGQIDLGGVRVMAGDYDERDLKNACDRPELIQRIVDEWQRLTPGKRTIAFCVDIEHAQHVAAAFRAVGVPADTVAGTTPIKERQQLYDALGQGDLLVLTSCNVISIGFDEPSVEVGLLLRPTQSKALHFQQIGRVMRISPQTGKTCGVILDQAGNLQRLGFPEDIQDYHLPTSRSPQMGHAIPMKQCPLCNRLMWIFLTECPGCSYQFPTEQQVCTDDMVELLSEAQLRQVEESRRYEFFKAQRRKTFENGLSPSWTRKVFFQTFAQWPREEWYRGAVFGDRPTLADQRAYKAYLLALAQQHGRSLSWVLNEFQKEFGPDAWRQVFAEG